MLNNKQQADDPVAEKEAPRSTGSGLTKGQKEATVQKWADWILRQRTAAKAGSAIEAPRAKTASA